MSSVNLKGTSSGIVLELDSKVSFEELLKDIADKFMHSKNFLGKSEMGLLLKGRNVNDSEENEIIDVVTKNSDIQITCVIREDSKLDQFFVHYMQNDNGQEEQNDIKPDAVAYDEGTEVDNELSDMILDSLDGVAKIYPGNLRSGQAISDKKSIVVLGDVKPGATVTSEGSIFVLGALRGSAFAGSMGDEKAFVLALDLDPLQIRIANAIAISPDSEKGPKLKMRKFRKKPDEKTTEVAYIQGGHVVKDIYGASFLRSHLGAK